MGKMKTKPAVLPQVRVSNKVAEAVHKKAHELNLPVSHIIDCCIRKTLGIKDIDL